MAARRMHGVLPASGERRPSRGSRAGASDSRRGIEPVWRFAVRSKHDGKAAERTKLTDRIRVSRAHESNSQTMNCKKCNRKPWNCECQRKQITPQLEPARSDADSVRVQRACSGKSADIEQLKALGRKLREVRRDDTNLANWRHADEGLVLQRIEAALVELVEIVTRNLEQSSPNSGTQRQNPHNPTV